jgi:hypothetical protein
MRSDMRLPEDENDFLTSEFGLSLKPKMRGEPQIPQRG